MTTINIFNYEILAKIIELIESRSQYNQRINLIREVLDRFPFTQLEDVDGSNLRVLTFISQILGTFVSSNLFSQDMKDVSHSIKFLLRNLHFISKEGEHLETAIILLETLLQFMSRYDVNCNINFDKFFELIISYTSVNGLLNKTVREFICRVFVQVVNLAEKSNLNAARCQFFVPCFTNLFIYIEGDIHLSLEFVNELVLVLGPKWSSYESLKYFIEISMRQITKETDSKTIIASFNLLQNVFKHDLDAKFCITVVTNILNKIDLFLTHTRKLSQKDRAIEVFAYLINIVFIDAPWEPELLKSQLNELLMYSSLDLIDNDIVYVIYYIEFLYCNKRHDRQKMTIKILQKLSQLPTDAKHNAALIKTMLLLYSVYIAPICNEEDKKLCQCLLNAVKPHLSSLLTYHRLQLCWFLHKGDDELKLKVLENWLLHHDSIDDIVELVNICNASKLFLDVAFALMPSCRDKCCKILSKLKNPPKRIWLYLGMAISKPNFEVLKYIFKSNPPIPGNKKLAALLSKNLSNVLCCIDDFETLEFCLTFCLKVLHRNGNSSEYAKPFYSKKIVTFLWKLAISSKESLSRVAIVFLRKLIELQELHAYKCETPVEIKFSDTVDYLSSANDMLYLLSKILKSDNENLILKVKSPAELYFYLLNRGDSIPKILLSSVTTLLSEKHKCFVASSHKQLISRYEKSCYQKDGVRSTSCKG